MSAHAHVAARPVARLAPCLAAVLSLAAGWVHVAFTEAHFESWWGYGAFFLAVGAGQTLFAPAIIRWPRPGLVLAGIAGNLAVVGLYVVSRTWGVWTGPRAGVPEHAEPADLATTAAEVALIGVLLALLAPRPRRWVANGLLALGALAWGLRLAGVMP